MHFPTDTIICSPCIYGDYLKPLHGILPLHNSFPLMLFILSSIFHSFKLRSTEKYLLLESTKKQENLGSFQMANCGLAN